MPTSPPRHKPAWAHRKPKAEHHSDAMTQVVKPSRKWYSTYRWQQIRARQLEAEPLCAICLGNGTVTTATVCDHITPHRESYEAFWNGATQSLCTYHHSSTKQASERRGGGGG